MGLNDKLIQLKNNIQTAKQGIVDALNSKGVSVTIDDNLSNMGEHITSIVSGGAMKWFDGLKFSQTISDAQLESIMSGVDFSEVTDFEGLLQDRSSFTTFPAFDTSRATNLNNLFRNCTSLVSLPYFDVSNAESIEGMIEGCTNLETVGGFGGLKQDFKFVMNSNLSHDSLMNIINNLANVDGKQLSIGQNNRDRLTDDEIAIATNKGWNVVVKLPYPGELFSKDASTTDEVIEHVFQGYDTANVTSMNSMFEYCSSLSKIPMIDTNNVTDMSYMFYECSSLVTIPEFNTSNVTAMSWMFNICNNLTTIPKLYTSKVINMDKMFQSCSKLTSISQLDTASVTNMDSMFYNCNKLRYALLKNLGTQPSIDSFMSHISMTLWGVEDENVPESVGARQSLVDSLITYSFDRATAGYAALRISLSTETKNVLTEEEKAAITAKGFTIA